MNRPCKIAWLFLVPLIILLTLVLLTIHLNPAGYTLAIGHGESMQPTINNPSVVIVDTSTTQYQEGDIVYYTYEDKHISHRISHEFDCTQHNKITSLENSKNCDEYDYLYSAKGDNNERNDPIVITDEHINGEVVYWVDMPHVE